MVGIPPGPDAARAVLAATRAGVPVRLDRLREWEPAVLLRLARRFVRDAAVEVPIEPFCSLFEQLLPGGAAWSLSSACGGPGVERPGLRGPCATCAAFKSCRGFWLGEASTAAQCAGWRSIVATLARAAAQASPPRPA
jgi:hypothetical protein